jgi:hypothetical protein
MLSNGVVLAVILGVTLNGALGALLRRSAPPPVTAA